MASAAHPYTVEMVGHGEEDREEHEEKHREEKHREKEQREKEQREKEQREKEQREKEQREKEQREKEQREKEQREKEQRERLPRRFDELPRDAQWLVLKHTGARFVVTRRTQEEPYQLGLPYDIFWPYFVPVIVRYEFRLLPRRASGPEMIARFTLSLDPAAIRTSPEWRYMSAEDHAVFDRPGCYMAREFEPFSQLEFDGFDDSDKLFCFLRTGPQDFEVAPRWSRFDDSVLTQVREKMETVFRLPLLRF
jgi:hypothetical protein